MKIIKFTALWCADCIVMRKAWKDIVLKFPDIIIEEFDFDDNPELAEQHGVKKVPHTIFIDDSGGVALRLEGMQNKDDLIKYINEHFIN